MAPVPQLRPLAFEVAFGRIIDGRNVGQGTTVAGGILYTFNGSPTR